MRGQTEPMGPGRKRRREVEEPQAPAGSRWKVPTSAVSTARRAFRRRADGHSGQLRELSHLVIVHLARSTVGVAEENEVTTRSQHAMNLAEVSLDQRPAREHEVRERIDAVHEVERGVGKGGTDRCRSSAVRLRSTPVHEGGGSRRRSSPATRPCRPRSGPAARERPGIARCRTRSRARVDEPRAHPTPRARPPPPRSPRRAALRCPASTAPRSLPRSSRPRRRRVAALGRYLRPRGLRARPSRAAAGSSRRWSGTRPHGPSRAHEGRLTARARRAEKARPLRWLPRPRCVERAP